MIYRKVHAQRMTVRGSSGKVCSDLRHRWVSSPIQSLVDGIMIGPA